MRPEGLVVDADRQRRDPELVRRMMLDFLTNLAHELRTPLVAIRGYTRLVMEGGVGELNEAQRSHLRKVLREANELVSATEALTFASRFDALRPAVLNVHELLMDCLPGAGNDGRGGKLVLGRAPSDPVLLIGDRDQLKVAFRTVLGEVASAADASTAIRVDCAIANGGKRFSIRIHGGGGEGEDSDADPPDPPGAAVSAARDVLRLHGGRLLWRRCGGLLEAVVSLPASGGVRREA